MSLGLVLLLAQGGGDDAPKTEPTVVPLTEDTSRLLRLEAVISKRFFESLEPPNFHRSAPVARTVDGAQVRGTSTTDGNVQLRLKPSKNSAVIEVDTSGRTISHTTSQRDPVCLRTKGVSDFSGGTTIVFEKTGVSSGDPNVDVHTKLHLCGVSSRLKGLFHRIAVKRATKAFHERRPKNTRRIEREIRDGCLTDLRGEVDETIEEISDLLDQAFFRPFNDHLLTGTLDFETTEANFFMRGWLVRGPSAPPMEAIPPIEGDPAFSLRIHQSLLDDLAKTDLAGKTLDNKQIRRFLKENFKEALERVEDENVPPWTIEFAAVEPVVIQFRDGKMVVVIDAESLHVGEATVGPLRIEATYTPADDSNIGESLRRGTIKVQRANSPKPQSVTGQLMDLLSQPLNQLLSFEISLRKIALPGYSSEQDQYKVTYVSLEKGWLNLSIDAPTSPSP
ncbi:hypothetical protein [Planctomycetes bacterium Pan216]|uniref:hypothetical protein n=1 Tax=Kolteria novifilia TaxID=2527975 RepID=UPI0011A27B39